VRHLRRPHAGDHRMLLTATLETVLPGRRCGQSAGDDFWITAHMGANRYATGGALLR
jgi:hypothetical protein